MGEIFCRTCGFRHEAGACPRWPSGTVKGQPVTDRDGIRWQQVFEYENGECVDRYVTKVGVQL